MRLETLCGTDKDCPPGVAVQRLYAGMRLAEFAPTVRQQRHYVSVRLSPRSPVTGRRKIRTRRSVEEEHRLCSGHGPQV